MASYIRELAAKRAASRDPIEREVLKRALNSLYGKMLQNKINNRNLVPFTDANAFVRACNSPQFRDAQIMLLDNEPGKPFFALVEMAKKGGIVLDTARACGFSILELSKAVVLRCHYGFFKRNYGANAKLLFTDTDSLALHVTTENLMRDLVRYMLTADEGQQVLFDMIEAVTDKDLEEYIPDEAARAPFKKKMEALDGGLGHFKIESKQNFIREFIGLASKMYSIEMVTRDGKLGFIRKAKGVPSFVVKLYAPHEKFRQMVLEPADFTHGFRALRSKNHTVEVLQLEKRVLTGFNDKVFQFAATESRPIGHWRNSGADSLLDA